MCENEFNSVFGKLFTVSTVILQNERDRSKKTKTIWNIFILYNITILSMVKKIKQIKHLVFLLGYFQASGSDFSDFISSISTPTVRNYPAGVYLFKVNNGRTRIMCKICSKWR